jgi:hypothetical protein
VPAKPQGHPVVGITFYGVYATWRYTMSTPRPKPRKEALFVRVVAPDESVEFHDVTEKIGAPMPFTNPRATLALRVSDAAVAFSLLHLTKRAAAGLVAKNVEFPRGPVARLERRIVEIAGELAPNELVVELNDHIHKFTMETDEAGVLEVIGDDTGFDLPRAAVQMSIFMHSGAARRPIGIGFIGHVGKPESSDTVRRMVSMVLNSISQLVTFRLLTGIDSVRVPAAPRAIVRPTRRSHERATVGFPVWLFTDGNNPILVNQGIVTAEVDLDQANPSTNRLLVRFHAEDALTEALAPYRVALDFAVSQKLRTFLGDEELKAIATDIVLGEVSSGTLERINAALATCQAGFDLTPGLHRDHV